MFDIGPALRCAERELQLDRPLIMGIVNVTPDSFSDGGDFVALDQAVAQAMALIEEGADLIDIGGESTRPGAEPVALDVELARVIPVIAAVREQIKARALPTVISVDTYKPEVMRAAAAAGAGMINDVRALSAEGALEAAAATSCAVVLMHHKGDPQSMQLDPHYEDVTAEVHRYLTERVFAAELAGIDRKRLLIDPGFGFGKNTQHNLELLARLEQLRSIQVPMLVGLSRKRTLGEITGREHAKDRVAASVAAHLLAVQKGAAIVRVHDVAQTRDALCVFNALRPLELHVRKDSEHRPAFEWPDD